MGRTKPLTMIEPTPDRRGLVWLRPKEVARRLGISKCLLYRYVREGRFQKPMKITSRWSAWREADVDRWMQEREQAGAGR